MTHTPPAAASVTRSCVPACLPARLLVCVCLPACLPVRWCVLMCRSDKRGPGGGRVIAGSVLLRLSATPGPGSSWLRTLLRLGCSFLITPHTLSLHTSGVLESLGRDERAAAAGRVVSEWLSDQGQAVVPDSLVNQVRVKGGRGFCAVLLVEAGWFCGRGARCCRSLAQKGSGSGLSCQCTPCSTRCAVC